MVLLVEGVPLPECPASTDEFFTHFTGVAQVGRNFANQKPRQVEAQHSLYVGQGEFGVVPGRDDRIQVVGSDDATTCHIVIIRHPRGTVAVAHFDGSPGEEATLETMVGRIAEIEGSGNGDVDGEVNGEEEGIREVEGEMDVLEVWVVGGYQPEQGSIEALKGEAERLSLKLLSALIRHPSHFRLCVWCTGQLNTTTQAPSSPCPMVYGVAVELASGVVFPAHFKTQEPNMPLRSAARWMATDRRPYDLYNHASSTITIQPFHYTEVDWFALYLKLPDEVLLQNFSTSPKVEPPHFCRDLRKVFKLFVDHPRPRETLFPAGKPMKYSISQSGVWELVL